MAVVTGFQDVTSGARASVVWDFKGGRCGYMVQDTPNTTADWDLQIQLPDGTWQDMGNASKQVDRGTPYANIGNLPSGKYRLHCDTAAEENWDDATLYWCYIPISMQDAALF